MADSPIGPDLSELANLAKQKAATIVGTAQDFVGNIPKSVSEGLNTLKSGLTKGAERFKIPSAKVNIVSKSGTTVPKDLRVKIRVPNEYLTELTVGPNGELGNIRGIIFPYTPSITYEHKAEYSETKVQHTNFPMFFYQRSTITPISIIGKFTVQSETDARLYLATVHLIRALTKMRFGTDSNSGSAPPICRLDAYGAFMFENTPVVISSFKVELPEGIDYYRSSGSSYGDALVPTLSTISVMCTPMYSRSEMQQSSVTGWLDNSYGRNKGIL